MARKDNTPPREGQKNTALSFKQFWDAYALKRDRIAAERAWNRLSAKDKRAAMEGIKPYRQDCADHNRMMMYAQGYLNHRRWEDDFTQPCEVGNEKTRTEQVQPSAGNAQLPDPEQRRRQYEERRQKAVSYEDAMKSDEYWKAFNEN